MSRKKNKTIYKNALISQVATKLSIEASEVDLVLKGIQDVILDNINNNYNTNISGFISFQNIQTAPRVGRDPDTNEKIRIPSVRRVNVRVSENYQKKIKQEELKDTE